MFQYLIENLRNATVDFSRMLHSFVLEKYQQAQSVSSPIVFEQSAIQFQFAWNTITSTISLMGDICVSAITIYMFYLGFISDKISIISSSHYYGLDGESFSLLLKNKSMRTISITSVNCIFKGKYRVKMDNFAESVILNPLGSVRISIPHYTLLDGFRIERDDL